MKKISEKQEKINQEKLNQEIKSDNNLFKLMLYGLEIGVIIMSVLIIKGLLW